MSDWISFKDKLPKKGERVLLWVTCDLVTIGWVDSEITDKLKIGLIDPINNRIVHSDLYTYGIKGWMPLPKANKGE